ncbi:ABC transporter ATP-binding protein [Propionimicrobium sp. PCR01-08-3]|uniref:ATP-binding cassette domain-containing protein n=1 Tax=Propionimicrobium sp. PCR01-08-3 TaxID=3052086 RepID=UPI00255C7DB1|nr:ABC transporter ATP-binding protein [Propionimicrobium sp. PCR01-08-3]WIY83378.1 ABC transporter ATP-binding protein [Propionimicrobium sp. PCR01-08-3]
MSAPNDVLLEVKNLTIGVPGTEIVHQASFSVPRGKVVALVGESGAGKSMTAMSIPHLLPPGVECSGSINFDGTELVGVSEKGMQHFRGPEIACVYQEPMTALNPLHTVGDFLSEAIRSHATSGSAGAKRSPQELLELVGLGGFNDLLDRYPHQISGGQRQRIMAAGAVAWKPKLLIADEPTTALDVTTQRNVLAMFRELVEHEKMSMIFVTHDMGVVADIADYVVVMRNGNVMESGDVFSIFADPADDYTRSLLSAARALHGARTATAEGSEVPGAAKRAAGDSAREGAVIDSVAAPALEVSGLTVEYKISRRRRKTVGVRNAAVAEADLFVRPGETLGIVGESGSGKSTIARSILGLTPTTAGVVSLADANMIGLKGRSRRNALSHLGMVFQDPTSSLDPSLPLWRILTEPLWRSGKMKDARELRKRAAELLTDVDLDPAWIDRRRHELSGGQRQRVAIARAISHRPEILLADEPTSALDVTVQVRVLELLARLQAEQHFACIFISHDLYVVSTISDRVMVMKDGHVVETGPTDQVIHNPENEYTRTLLGAIPVPDPVTQRRRRAAV